MNNAEKRNLRKMSRENKKKSGNRKSLKEGKCTKKRNYEKRNI